MRAITAYLAAAVSIVAAVAGPAWADDPPQSPVLRIEAGGHIGAVARLSIDSAGRTMASASYDKTVRIWSVADGRQLAVLRPPIGAREEGELYAVALTPDGNRAFVGGATGRTWDGAYDIFVYDVARASLAGLLTGLPGPVNDLRVSAKGTRLAAGLGQGGVKVWDAASGKPVFSDAAYNGPVRQVAFDAQDRLFATSADGHVRAYDPGGQKIADVTACVGSHPWGLALSPDGGLAAVTCETADRQGRMRVEVLSTRTLAPVFAPDTTGLTGEGLLAVAWSSDGHGGVQLAAGGYAHGPTGYVLRRWNDFGLGAYNDIPAARDTIRDITPLPGGGLVYAAEDPGWGMLGGDGRLKRRPAPPLADLRPSRERRLAVSPDGGIVEFATADGLNRFDVRAHSLAAIDASGPKLSVARTEQTGLLLEGFRDSSQPRLNRQPLVLEKGDISRAASLLPDETGLVLGTDNSLRTYGRDGKLAASLDMPAPVRAVAVGGNGTVAVATLLDGTVRWYGISETHALSERAALFAHADGVRWVLYTPEGFFDHADRGGNDLVGVHLNRARNQQPEWLGISQAYRVLYAPSVVRARLLGEPAATQTRLAELGDLRARLARQPTVAITQVCTGTANGACNPLDRRGNAASKAAAGATSGRLFVEVADRGLGVGPLDAFVNGRNVGRTTPRPGVPVPINIPLDPGSSAVQLRVYDSAGAVFSESPVLTIEREDAAKPAPDPLASGTAVAASTGSSAPGGGSEPASTVSTKAGRLFVLGIGIDHFANPTLSLHFAVADEHSLIDTLTAAARPIFSDVQVISLTDAQANRAGILAAFDKLAGEVKPDDTFIFYVASHGILDEDTNRFMLIPSDVQDISSWSSIASQSIDQETMVAALARIEARDSLLLIDTCHSGQVTADNLANVGHETGRYLIAASSSVQEALDSYDGRNGVFIVALREALAGKAGQDGDGNIGVLSLGEYLSRRVGQLARQRDHAQDAVFRAAQRDLRSFAIGRVGAVRESK